MASIVLAHGILGFGGPPGRLRNLYFNGVAAHYEKLGHQVLVPSVPPLGPLDLRAEELARDIEAAWPTQAGIIVIGHSMGGLDIRRVVARMPRIAERVQAITCVATPHLGSPLADAVLNSTDPLRPAIPAGLLDLLERHVGAVEDLRTRAVLQDPDVAGIRYLEVGGDCALASTPSPLFALSQAMARMGHAGNDGVVPLNSAHHPARPLAAVWPVDHWGAIGWPTAWPGWDLLKALSEPPADHLRRYEGLLALALAA